MVVEKIAHFEMAYMRNSFSLASFAWSRGFLTDDSCVRACVFVRFQCVCILYAILFTHWMRIVRVNADVCLQFYMFSRSFLNRIHELEPVVQHFAVHLCVHIHFTISHFCCCFMCVSTVTVCVRACVRVYFHFYTLFWRKWEWSQSIIYEIFFLCIPRNVRCVGVYVLV